MNFINKKRNHEALRLESNLVRKELEHIEKCRLFSSWIKKFALSGCVIEDLKILAAVKKNDYEYRSIFVNFTYITPENVQQTRSILLRGNSVVVIPYIKLKGTLYFVVVKQRRVLDGNYTYEFPAGGAVDCDHQNCLCIEKSASLELLEETGLLISKNRFEIIAKNLKVCPSAFDETATWFVVQLTKQEVDSLPELSGQISDGEYTFPVLISYSDLLNHPSFQTYTGLALLNQKK